MMIFPPCKISLKWIISSSGRKKVDRDAVKVRSSTLAGEQTVTTASWSTVRAKRSSLTRMAPSSASTRASVRGTSTGARTRTALSPRLLWPSTLLLRVNDGMPTGSRGTYFTQTSKHTTQDYDPFNLSDRLKWCVEVKLFLVIYRKSTNQIFFFQIHKSCERKPRKDALMCLSCW